MKAAVTKKHCIYLVYVSKRLHLTKLPNKENTLEKSQKMAQKRASDALVAMPDMKRARNELVAVTNRDKALLEAVCKFMSTSDTLRSI